MTATASAPSAILESRQASTEDALNWFDSLAPVDAAALIGLWRGAEIRTGHPMDGWLEASGWYGKEFVDAETVHPLLFRGARGGIVRVVPNPLAMRSLRRMPFLKAPFWRPALQMTTALLATQHSCARLRMVECRGQVSAAMVYDSLPIIDCFRRIDNDRILGIMDEKGVAQPYVFLLERDVCPSRYPQQPRP
ncbi:DUF4334 domain-containing protein [Synechococcus sp. CCY9201]|nr:DUF4334 domain-containing protein [Synechococcus sp. CCY9201]MEA5475272.1 DUF4334 domain-containing protein [Synechococcus sp. CCY9201]